MRLVCCGLAYSEAMIGMAWTAKQCAGGSGDTAVLGQIEQVQCMKPAVSSNGTMLVTVLLLH